MGTRNRLTLIASGAAVLLGGATLGITTWRAASPSDSDGVVQSPKKGKRQKMLPVSIAEPKTACADPANDECEPQQDDQRVAGIEAHKDRWLKDRYRVEIAYDPNAGTETAATGNSPPGQAPQSPEEANARLAEGQQRIVELFPELKDSVEKMNSEVAAERKLVDETGMTQQERAIHKYMNP